MWEDGRLELMLTHSCTTVFLHQDQVGGEWRATREIQWNCQPNTVILVFPFLLALSAGSNTNIEFKAKCFPHLDDRYLVVTSDHSRRSTAMLIAQ